MYWYIHSVKLHKTSEENVERLKFKAMEYNKLFYKECHWVGCQYHDIDEVWTELKVGTLLQLERDKDNRYDKNAIAAFYEKQQSDNSQTKFLIGYIPATETHSLAPFLDMG